MNVNREEHNLLTLDFWQDEVTYEGKPQPCGSIGCAALNIPDETIAELTLTCQPLNNIVAAIMTNQVSVDVLVTAKDCLLTVIYLLRDVPPFCDLDCDYFEKRIPEIFMDDYLNNAVDYAHAASETGVAVALDGKYKHGVGLLKVIQVAAQLPSSLTLYKQSVLPFAEALHESDRTPDGYAAAFGEYFSSTPTFSLNNPSWLALTNVSMQYVSELMPGKDAPQLVKRMHYVSFVGMFRSDLFEGLCVGHAPRKCPICGRWFLTTDARHTKYCGGLAPRDKRRRTCRQIGNLQGRAQRELADDHPIKAIYARRMNTIIQCQRRGTLDETLADEMKRLGKNKLERAISDTAYASGSYAEEMEQASLMSEAKKYLR